MSGHRHPDRTVVAVSIAKELLAEIDAAAREENRNRSNWVETELSKAIAARKKKKRGTK